MDTLNTTYLLNVFEPAIFFNFISYYGVKYSVFSLKRTENYDLLAILGNQ